MSNTDAMRELLESHGVSWFGSYDSDETHWGAGELTWVYASDDNISSLWVDQNDVTPEQAFKATLVHGTCHIIERKGDYFCDACDNEVASSDPTSELYTDGNAIELWDFCPCCGARIER